MNIPFLRSLVAVLCVVATMTATARISWGQGAQPSIVAGEERQSYFLIDHSQGNVPPEGYKLLLVLPGGDGGSDFHGFVSRIGEFAAGDDYLVAQLVSVKWTPNQQIVWPTKESPVEGMAFTTEQFLSAVIDEVRKSRKIDPEHVYTLSWSSSGPAAYAASLRVPEIKGSFVAMSVFKPDRLPALTKAKGHRYFIYHSADDRVCPLRMAHDARDRLTKAGADVQFAAYEGGHGWHGNVFAEIRSGLSWLEAR